MTDKATRAATHLADIGLTEVDLARVRGQRLIELVAIVERLERLIHRDQIAVWLRKPIPLLDDDKALDVVGRGEYRRVAQVISGLEDPGVV